MIDSSAQDERSQKPPRRESVSRRDFLRVGGVSVVGLSVAERSALARWRKSGHTGQCILLTMTGGPSQFETFDPKPSAPLEVRGPAKAIATSVPGVQFSEGLPKLAERADRLAVVRTMSHEFAPVHETGLQLVQTGRLVSAGLEPPSVGAVAAAVHGSPGRVPPYVVLPKLIDGTGVRAYHGQTAGWLGARYDPVVPQETTADLETTLPSLDHEDDRTRQAYGDHRFGRLCLKARQLVECGVRVVTVNLFDSLADGPTWDAHGKGADASGGSTLYDYRDTLCPAFDRAVAALLDDLADRGLLQQTLVVATGEFGRTPRLNERGGRDHWTKSGIAMLAGGGVRGGTVVGATDPTGSSIQERPVHPGELVATMLHSLGVERTDERVAAPDGVRDLLADRAPIDELFA